MLYLLFYICFKWFFTFKLKVWFALQFRAIKAKTLKLKSCPSFYFISCFLIQISSYRNTFLKCNQWQLWDFPDGTIVKNLPASAGDVRDMGSISGLEGSPGGGRGNPLQYSCLENPTDRGAWWATVHGIAKSRTLLKQLACMNFQLISIRCRLLQTFYCTFKICSIT